MPETATTPATPGRKRLPILARHAVSLAVVFALALPLSFYAGKRIYRYLQLAKLESVEQAEFKEGVAYVYANATDRHVIEHVADTCDSLTPDRAADLLLALASAQPEKTASPEPVYDALGPLLKRMSIEQAVGLYDALVQSPGFDAERGAGLLLANLQTDSDAGLLLAVDLLDNRLLWSLEQAPRGMWIDWLAVLAKSKAELTQHKAARLLGELPDDLSSPRIATALSALSKSKHATVRAQVLHTAAGYAAIAQDPTDFEQIIFALGSDENKVIARRAWMIVGHLEPLSGYAVKWKQADPSVAEAMLWASVKAAPSNTKPALDAFAQPATRALSYFALSLVEEEEAIRAIEDSVLDKSFTDTPALAWRHLLAIARDHEPPHPIRDHVRIRILEYAGKTSDAPSIYPQWNWADHTGPLLASVYYAYGVKPDDLPEDLAPAWDTARMEGAARFWKPGEEPYLGLTRETHPLVRMYAAAAGGSLDFERFEIENLIDADPALLSLATASLLNESTVIFDAPMWDEQMLDPTKGSLIKLNALYAGIAKAKPTLVAGVTAQLLRKNPDLTNEQIQALSDSELSKLGLKRIDALPALLEAAESAPASAGRKNEAKLLRLALWMRGDLGDDFTPKAEAMLFDKDLPTSTVLMCLLHMKRPIAMEYLFGDLVTPRPNLHELFVQQRFWHVFRRFVDTSDLKLWLWGDAEAQAFQIEAMRQWYAVNRLRIERGWWPEPTGE